MNFEPFDLFSSIVSPKNCKSSLNILAKELEKRGTKWANVSLNYERVIPFFKQLIIKTELNNEDKLDYEGSYTTMMKRLMDDGEYDWLDFRIPDYPDYGLVTKDINDIFGQYI